MTALQYCLDPAHTADGTPAWFEADKPSRYCPRHEPAPKPKPRVRWVDGQWVEVRDVSHA